MDTIYSMLEKHETWIKSLEPTGDDAAKEQHWNLILMQIHNNLKLHEMLVDIESAKTHGQNKVGEPTVPGRGRGQIAKPIPAITE